VWTEETLNAWTAGIIDGEGSILISPRQRRKGNKCKQGYQVRVSVANTDVKMIIKLHDNWGGSFYHYHNKNEKRKDYYIWGIVDKQAEKLLKCIIPYLITKKDVGELALELRRRINNKIGRNPNIFSDEEKIIRLNIYEKSKQLNQRGVG
jgi:hypothetical protein